jgi:hypothetical protein
VRGNFVLISMAFKFRIRHRPANRRACRCKLGDEYPDRGLRGRARVFSRKIDRLSIRKMRLNKELEKIAVRGAKVWAEQMSLRAKRGNPALEPQKNGARKAGLPRRFAPRNDDCRDSHLAYRAFWPPYKLRFNEIAISLARIPVVIAMLHRITHALVVDIAAAISRIFF